MVHDAQKHQGMNHHFRGNYFLARHFENFKPSPLSEFLEDQWICAPKHSNKLSMNNPTNWPVVNQN